ncbi:MAG: FtsQ-type POTRA domain-containing protein [Chloroflexota bacterium]|nr:FtsQ-type POTRA domain-containing protein [Chloroflexota bacterium]
MPVPSDPARVVAGIIALLCAAGVGAIAYAPLEPISAVGVSGAHHLTVAQAVAATGLAGMPIFRASSADARAALLRLPAVRDARVDLELPGSAAVTLVEREPVGRWVVGATEWFVDADGVLFASADPSAAPALRVRDERAPSRTAGERIDPALVAAAIRLAKIGPGELRPDATAPSVRIEPGPNGIVLESGAGWEIRFGTPEHIEDKLSAALRFLRERPDRRLEYVDVRNPDRIVYSPQ